VRFFWSWHGAYFTLPPELPATTPATAAGATATATATATTAPTATATFTIAAGAGASNVMVISAPHEKVLPRSRYGKEKHGQG